MLSRRILRRLGAVRPYRWSLSSQRFATSSENDFEIDLITLKKTRRSHPHADPDSRVTAAFESLSYFESFKSRSVDGDYVKQAITKAKAYVVSPKQSPFTDEDKGYLQFAELYQRELQHFLGFIRNAYDAKIKRFDQLTSVEVLNALYIFKNYYQNGKIPEVTKYNFASYNHMFGRLAKYLTNDKQFPVILTRELIPYVNDIAVLQALYRDGVGNFVEELNSLAKEFDFSRIDTCSQLSTEINKTLDQFTSFLNRTSEFNDFKVDATFFRILIQINRYKSLKKVLDSHPKVAIRHLQTITTDPDSIIINDVIKDSSGINSEIHQSLDAAAPYYQMLRCTRNITISDFESFLSTAPSLYEWAKSGNDKVVQNASFKVLQVTLSLFNSGLVSAAQTGEVFKYLTSGNNFGSQNLIEAIPGDPLVNYEATIFYYSGLFESLDILRLLRSRLGKPFANMSISELAISMETYVSHSSAHRFSDELVLVDNALNWFTYYVPWTDFSIFDEILDSKKLTQKLAEQNQQVMQKFNDLSKEDALNLFTNRQLLILKDFKKWLGGHELGVFNSARLAYYFSRYVVEKGSSEELEQVSSIISDYSSEHYFTNVFDEVLTGIKPYVQIPDELTLEQFVDQLSILRKNVLVSNYQDVSPTRILESLSTEIEKAFAGTSNCIDEESVFDYIRLKRRLGQLFELNGGHTEVLDALLRSSSVFEQLERKIEDKSKKEYAQIPEDLGLHKFYDELEILRNDELKKPFEDATVAEIQSLLSARINEIYDNDYKANSASRMNDKNVIRFVKLSKRLASLFETNGGYTGILDTLIYNQEVCDVLDARLTAKKGKEYVQVPDDLEIYKFSDQLEAFRDDVLKKPYKDSSVQEINSLLDKVIDEVMNDGLVIEGSSINSENIYNFVKLSKRLTRLFDINGGHTAVLDTLIHSQSVFKEFEKKLSKNTRKYQTKKLIRGSSPAPVYKQLPDDFLLQEFTPELIQLQNELNKSYASSTSQEIIDKLDSLIDREANGDKKVTWIQLQRNLRVLFKYNNNSTFVLDSVLINSDSFLKFESNKTFSKLTKRENSLIGENSKLINDSFEYVENFLKKSEILARSDIWEVTRTEFSLLLDKFKENLNPKAYDYPMYLNLIRELSKLNASLEYYPNFLQELYEIKANNSNKRMSVQDVEVIYKAFIENFEYEDEKNWSLEPISKFDMREFTSEGPVKSQVTPKYDIVDDAETVALKSDYNDSERLLSILTKSEESVDLENNAVLGVHLENNSEDRSELDIRDAVSIALNGSRPHKSKQVKHKKHRHDTHDLDGSIASGELSDSISSSLETFLKNAKKEQELINEMQFRQSKAFEWSNSMANSHRSLESHNFFDPLNSGTRRSNNLFFPTSSSIEPELTNIEYLLLTVDGDTIRTDKSSIGHLPEQDIFQTLSTFEKSDLDQFVRNFKSLQRRSWKVVGSKVDGDRKYLILSRPVVSRSRVFLSGIKTILATTGVILASLVGLNLWLEEPQPGEKLEVSRKPQIAEPSHILPMPEEPRERPPEARRTSNWSSWLWSDKK